MRPPGWRAAGPKCSLCTPTPVSGRLFSYSPTRFLTEGSGTSAASEPTWGGEMGKLRSVNLVHFIFLDHFSKGREQQSQRNLNTLSWTGGEKRREGGQTPRCQGGGRQSKCMRSIPRTPSWTAPGLLLGLPVSCVRERHTRPSPLYPSLSAPLSISVFHLCCETSHQDES